MKYTSKQGQIWETNLMGMLVDRCDNCNKTGFGKKLMDHNMLCGECYYDKCTCVCEECGREISAFDYNDYQGLCGYCHNGTEVQVCEQCGNEFTVFENSSDCICEQCNKW